MQLSEILIIGASSFVGLYFSIYNLVKRFKFTLNRLYSLLAFLVSIQYLLLLLQLLNIESFPLALIGRAYSALVVIISQLFFHLMQIYPDRLVRKRLIYIIISGIPGISVAAMVLFSNFFIADVTFRDDLYMHPGPFYEYYLWLIAAYLSGAVLILVYKTFKMKNKSLKREMLLLLAGISFSVATIIIISIVFPLIFKIVIFEDIGHAIAVSYMLVLLNYSVVDFINLNLKKIYLTTVYLIIVFILLFVPIVLVVTYIDIVFDDKNIAIASISIFLFVYLAIFFSRIRPRIEFMMQREYISLVNSFNETFQNINDFSYSSEQEVFWDSFYKGSIEVLVRRYKISGGYFFLYNKIDKDYKLAYSHGKVIRKKTIRTDHPLVKSIRGDVTIVDSAVLDFNENFQPYKDDISEFFEYNEIEIMIPFFNQEKKVMGLLFLGRLPGNRVYSKNFISVLDLFRIQFQHQLMNGLILEEVKARQIVEHDRMVAKSIKSKIKPGALKEVRGVEVSSFYINNSMYGGDYFSSIKINEEKAAYIIADTSYSDIESGILSLELYTVLNSQVRGLDSPDEILNTLNWVICTSRFSTKYSPVFCFVLSSNNELEYSNAAHNPLEVYNPRRNEFITYDLKGIPVGVDKGFHYEKKSVKLEQGSIGMIYSDGFTSSINEKGDTYKIKRVKDIIIERKMESPKQLVREIYSDLSEFIGNKKQVNDITLILFKV